jgi:hypothetical protein
MFALLPYIEQDNIVRTLGQSNVYYSWGSAGNVNAQTVVVKTYLCPSDASHNNGTGPNTGWTITSYSRNWYMFDQGGGYQASQGGHYYTLPKYTIGNIPDGSSNTIGILERYAYLSNYGWSSLWTHHGQDRFHWGYSQWAPVHGPWGIYTPQFGLKYNQAHPYYPNSGHPTTNQSLLMDGSVKGVSQGINANTWSWAIQADDGQVLGSNW